MKRILKSFLLILSVICMLCFAACGSKTSSEQVLPSDASSEISDVTSSVSQSENATSETKYSNDGITVTEDGEYSDKEHVALYIHEFGHLPSNYVTKKEAQKSGWVSSEGNLNIVLPGKSIGGDHFGNYEGQLPSGYSYTECDIGYNPDGDTENPVYRGSERIIFNEEGMIFYTDDHYETFEQLY